MGNSDRSYKKIYQKLPPLSSSHTPHTPHTSHTLLFSADPTLICHSLFPILSMIFVCCRSQKHKKKIIRAMAFLLLSLVVGLTIGYFTPTKWGNYSNENGAIAIYVYNSGIHTDILVPVKTPLWNWQESIDLQSIDVRSNSLEYLGFGFGDRTFFIETYQGAFPKISSLLSALFLPTPSTILVSFYRNIPHNLPQIKCLKISNYHYLQLANFINNSFQLDSENKKVIIEQLPSYRGSFYEAKANYSILRSCNDWTAETLRNAEINTPVWSGLSSAIMWHLKSNC